MSWIVDKDVVQQAIKNSVLIEEDKVECRPEKIPNSILDDSIDVCNYFSNDAWLLLLQLKLKNIIWTCNICNHDLHSEAAILCDSCLLWYHFKCVGSKEATKFGFVEIVISLLNKSSSLLNVFNIPR